ncbi:hypothetical protein LTR08_000703 [Meristemomyces frigidus]|nr:hypothetical protein LTR08_000703 [Meristemomyces frigidus]
MSAAPKKPPTPAHPNRRASANITQTASSPSSNSSNPNRSPSRMAPGASTVTSAAATVNRTRSVRNAAPLSARAAARSKPAESDAAVDDVRGEMQAQLDELQERLQEAEKTCEDSKKQAAFLQIKLDEARKEQGALEENVHEHTEHIEELQNEKKESLRAKREFEQIYEAERVQSMKEREQAQTKEEDMQSALQRMKETLAQREMRAGLEDDRRPSMSRGSSFRSSPGSPNPDTTGQFAPPSSIQRSDSRSSSKLVMQKDKIIEALRLELAEVQIKLVEMENMGGGRMHELQKQMYEIKIQNGRLMEENESFQLLLSQKTLNGDFSYNEMLHPPSMAGSRPPSRQPNEGGGATLADELDSQPDSIEGISDEHAKRLQIEVNSMKDQNKALTLYINNIISRLLQHEQFEQILDKTPDIMAGPEAISRKYAAAAAAAAGSVDTDKELPPPPPEKDSQPTEQPEQVHPSGFLQRAKSVMGGRPKARPMSQMVGSMEQDRLQRQLKTDDQRLNENPDTAPRIPLSRSHSRGGNSAHRRSQSEWPAASVVGSMYRGASPNLNGGSMASPGLTSPTGRPGFFPTAQPLMSRAPSGSTVPTISEQQSTASNKENAVPVSQRDSKVSNPASHRSSVISNNNNLDVESSDRQQDMAVTSNPSSPPRSTTSSGDRDTSRMGGAIMMGSKPRPLRLVQEAAGQDDAARKAANRGSWFGWMNKGAVGPGPNGRSMSGGPDGNGQ